MVSDTCSFVPVRNVVGRSSGTIGKGRDRAGLLYRCELVIMVRLRRYAATESSGDHVRLQRTQIPGIQQRSVPILSIANSLTEGKGAISHE